MGERNEVFVGRLGQNPVLKDVKNGEKICVMSVAVNGETREEVEWKAVVVFGPQALRCGRELRRGKQVFVQGQNVSKEFTNKSGEVIEVSETRARLIGFTGV